LISDSHLPFLALLGDVACKRFWDDCNGFSPLTHPLYLPQSSTWVPIEGTIWVHRRLVNSSIPITRKAVICGGAWEREFTKFPILLQPTHSDLALKAVDDMLTFLRNGGAVGIFDATNSSRERRELIYNKLTAQGVQVWEGW